MAQQYLLGKHVIVPHVNMLNMQLAQQLLGTGCRFLPFHSSIVDMGTGFCGCAGSGYRLGDALGAGCSVALA